MTGLAVQMDLLDHKSVMNAVDATLECFGTIDVLVNNAIYQGSGTLSPFADLTEADTSKMFEGNVFAHLAVIRRVSAGGCSPWWWNDRQHGVGCGVQRPAGESRQGWMGARLCDDQGGIRAGGADPARRIRRPRHPRVQRRPRPDDHREDGGGRSRRLLRGALPDGDAGRHRTGDPLAGDRSGSEAFAGKVVIAQALVRERSLVPGWSG